MKYYAAGILLVLIVLTILWAVTPEDTPQPSTAVPTAPSNNSIRNLRIN